MTNAELYEKLGTALVEDGTLMQQEFKDLSSRVDQRKGITLEKLLMEEAGVKAEKLALTKSMVLGIPYCDVTRLKIDAEVLKLLSKEKAIKYCSIPICFDEYDSSVLRIVTDDPLDFMKTDDLRIITEHEVLFYLGTREGILGKIEECYSGAADRVNDSKATADVTDGSNAMKAAGATENHKETGDDGIVRYDVNEEFAHSGIIKAGDFYYLGYCVGNVGGTIEEQVNGAFDHMERRLKMVGLTLENVIQMDCLFRDVWNIPVMERVIKKRFHGKYPVRKSIQTEFAHVGGEDGLAFQVDGIAYAKK